MGCRMKFSVFVSALMMTGCASTPRPDWGLPDCLDIFKSWTLVVSENGYSNFEHREDGGAESFFARQHSLQVFFKFFPIKKQGHSFVGNRFLPWIQRVEEHQKRGKEVFATQKVLLECVHDNEFYRVAMYLPAEALDARQDEEIVNLCNVEWMECTVE